RESPVLTCPGWLLRLPTFPHERHTLLEATAALVERHVERLELFFEPATHDAQQQATFRQLVDRRSLLGHDQGMALRQDQAPDAQPHEATGTCSKSQQGHGLVSG